MRFRGLFFALLIVFFAQGAALGEAVFEGPQDEIDAIFALFTQLGAARDAGDMDAVVAAYHPETQIMTLDRALLSGPGVVRTFYAENYSTGSKRQLKNAFSEVRVFGSAAIVTGTSIHQARMDCCY